MKEIFDVLKCLWIASLNIIETSIVILILMSCGIRAHSLASGCSRREDNILPVLLRKIMTMSPNTIKIYPLFYALGKLQNETAV